MGDIAVHGTPESGIYSINSGIYIHISYTCDGCEKETVRRIYGDFYTVHRCFFGLSCRFLCYMAVIQLQVF